MIEVRELTKRYGRTLAVNQLSFQAKPGLVTGFLGPNGAGKSTIMRAILGLDAPDSGEALVDGRPYVRIKHPMRVVGALLDASSVHPGRSALNHLRALARTNGIGSATVVSTMERVGLAGAARKKVGSYSLGMKQRLGIAAALLGDPAILMLDEPVNGLDPEGVRWIRELMRGLAAKGRTVLVSSHLMSEMELTADRLIIIGRGSLIADTTVSELSSRFQQGVLVHSPRVADLAALLTGAGADVTPEAGGLSVHGIDIPSIGDLAAAHGIALHQVTPRGASLEEAYMRLTADSVEYRAVAS